MCKNWIRNKNKSTVLSINIKKWINSYPRSILNLRLWWNKMLTSGVKLKIYGKRKRVFYNNPFSYRKVKRPMRLSLKTWCKAKFNRRKLSLRKLRKRIKRLRWLERTVFCSLAILHKVTMEVPRLKFTRLFFRDSWIFSSTSSKMRSKCLSKKLCYAFAVIDLMPLSCNILKISGFITIRCIDPLECHPSWGKALFPWPCRSLPL